MSPEQREQQKVLDAQIGAVLQQHRGVIDRAFEVLDVASTDKRMSVPIWGGGSWTDQTRGLYFVLTGLLLGAGVPAFEATMIAARFAVEKNDQDALRITEPSGTA